MTALARFIRCLFNPWTWTMAWRDSRNSRRRLLLYAASIVLGIAALTAISSFGRQMEQTIREQSKALLGADLVVTSRDPFTGEQNDFLEGLGGEQSREVAFPSMIYFVKTDDTRLAQIRALGGDFPFYGAFETVPIEAVSQLRAGTGALVEQNLLEMFQAQVGDPIKVGEITLPIAGALTEVPGETVAFGTLAPRVYIPLAQLERTGLLGPGNLARHKVYFRFPPEWDVEVPVVGWENRLRRLGLRFDTVEERQRDLGRAMDHLIRFLNLVGFVALLLGGVGVASGVHVHITQKLGTVATLRCLGSSAPQASAIYLAQAAVLGLIGSTAGAALGLIVQMALPAVVADFLPFSITAGLSWGALGTGMGIGFLVCLLFAALPLLPLRKIPPLAALRSAFSHEAPSAKDPFVWLAYGGIGLGLVVFGVTQSRDWEDGLGYAAGIALAFGLLAAAAWGMVRICRTIVTASWPFVLRQGFSNLHRPNNRTLLVMISLGMGTFLVLTMFLVQRNLLRELLPAHRGHQGNAVLFDIQSDQKMDLLALLAAQNLPVVQDAPMVSMRLQSVKGRSVEELRQDRRSGIRRWVLNREYRSTYRGELAPTEKLVAGTWHERAEDLDEPIPVSLEQGIAEDLRVELGDELVFDVQGIPVATRVASLREVDWRQLSPNFFVVFPLGAIEAAPAIHMLVTRVESSEQSARLQREVVRRFPNVSAADLTLALQTLDNILDKISFVLRFMAMFTVGTGLLVLAGTIVSGRYQRLRESILLRTLGATRRQVLQILTAEYLFLGGLAAATGILLAVAASWALARFVFEVKFGFYPLPLLATFAAVCSLTVLAGLLGNRVLLNRPPLEVLRADG